MIKLVVSGCCGKMGRRITVLAGADKEFNLIGGVEAQGHPAVGKRISEVLMNPRLGMEIKDTLEIIKDADVLIEFTTPSATIEHLTSAFRYKKAMVIGTTGLNEQQVQKIRQAASQIPIVYSANMSLGVNLVFKLVKQAAQKLSSDYQADIVEAHHIQKKDAPSGTAKRLAELIKEANLRQSEHIRIESIRKGEIVGDHQVRFSSPQDMIIIKHSAKTRDIFAQGALAAAKFVVQQQPGLYDMQDVIG